jgi:hypothetical protein
MEPKNSHADNFSPSLVYPILSKKSSINDAQTIINKKLNKITFMLDFFRIGIFIIIGFFSAYYWFPKLKSHCEILFHPFK